MMRMSPPDFRPWFRIWNGLLTETRTVLCAIPNPLLSGRTDPKAMVEHLGSKMFY